MDLYLVAFIKSLLLPPGIFIVLLVLTYYLYRRKSQLAGFVLTSTSIFFTLLSLPVVSGLLMTLVETHPALSAIDVQKSEAKAIIVLGSGREHDALEYGGGDVLSSRALARLRYGAYLHRMSGVPILLTGGKWRDDEEPEALLMATTLKEDFGINARWIEGESKNTAQNAQFSKKILQSENTDTIFLVSHAWHLSRAVNIFEREGFTVIPAPTLFEGFGSGHKGLIFADFLPSMSAFHDNYYALHELLGIIWYQLRY